MKRRDFGLLAGTSLAAAAVARPANAQSAAPDPELLKTTLTPMGAERAGNADGSIPSWAGPFSVPEGTTANMAVFTDEKPLYTVDATNLSRYDNLVTAGVQKMMRKYGYSIQVYQCHRTAAAPQYVYDNTYKNVTRAALNPKGGRLGFTGAYGGVPFPFIDTSEPLVGGAQLIWNHLLAFPGWCRYVTMSPSVVVAGGKPVLSSGIFTRFNYNYYDPNGSLENFNGYFSYTHETYLAPPNIQGQEQLVWHSTNVADQPDITWTLLNGQGRVRKAPDEAYDTPNPYTNGISNIDESECFYGNPSQYDWHYIAKQEMLIPYNCNALQFLTADKVCLPKFPNPEYVRWEKHRVWVLEATLHPGKDNVIAKRRFYIDEDTWNIVLGEGYDRDGSMVKVYFQMLKTTPVVPVNVYEAGVTFNLRTGDYAYLALCPYGSFPSKDVYGPLAMSYFEPQQMAANAAF